MRPAGPVAPVWLLVRAVQRVQARGGGQRHRPAGLHAHEQVHPVFKVCAVLEPVGRQLGLGYVGQGECVTD